MKKWVSSGSEVNC